MTDAPAKKVAASNVAKDVDEGKESGHDRLDRIADSVGYSAEATAVRELVEFVRDNTPDSKLGKRTKTADEDEEE